MRFILAPPHHFVVPSPYKQGESAVRFKSPAWSFSFLISPFSFLNHSFAIISAGRTRNTWWRW